MFPNGYNFRPINCCSFANFVTGSSQLLVPGRVTAAEFIPQGSASNAIEINAILNQPDIQQLSVGLSQTGAIILNEKSLKTWNQNIHWIRAVRISDDCHSFNVQLSLKTKNYQNHPELILQAVKPIETNRELLMWFSEDLLAMLQVGFLTPINIQGQKKYVCHRCSTMYESPNPLKLHLTLGCGKNSISLLWQRLATIIKDNNYKKPESFNFKLSPEPKDLDQKSDAMDLSLPSETKPQTPGNFYRPFKDSPSAFKPFKKDSIVKFEPGIQIISPMYPDEAHMETLASSFVKSEQGHVCIYCGKCYSRKYGLKIHIRTHTGYKPLKCKFCSRPFGDPSNLNKHVRLHAEGDTPYKCDLCGKILVRRRDLKRHLKSRHMIEMHPNVSALEENEDDVLIVEDSSTSKESC